MTFIEQFERQLGGMMEIEPDAAEIIRWASEKVLESYRNGIKAGREGATVKRDGRSRRRGGPWTPGQREQHGEPVRRGKAAKQAREVGN